MNIKEELFTNLFLLFFFSEYLQDLSEVLLFLLLPPGDFHNKPFRYIARVSDLATASLSCVQCQNTYHSIMIMTEYNLLVAFGMQ